MSGAKTNGFGTHSARDFDDGLGAGSAVAERPKQQAAASKGREVTSWDAYRNWLTKVQAPEQRRSLPDPALFSFKGYRSWAEKIRRDWEDEE